MYRVLKHQETLQYSLEIKNLKSPAYFTPPHIYQLTETSLPIKLQVVLPDIQDI